MTDTLIKELNTRARLEYVIEPKKIIGERLNAVARVNKAEFIKAKFIDIGIKNNSWNRRHFVVIGPKKDGSSFSYGFSLMPGSVKKERWTVGTKVYRKNSVGVKKLLVTIKAADEEKTVNLFD